MNYLEVKFKEEDKLAVDTADFISNIIDSQITLGLEKNDKPFNHNQLLELGFEYNNTAKGYSLTKEFELDELKYLAQEVDLLDNHILTHAYIDLKMYQGELYFWDKALIYENIDTFEYCLKHHNLFKIAGLNVVTKSDTISEELLNIINYTKRYSTPSPEFIIQNCLWDKKEGQKVLKNFIADINEYIPKDYCKF